MAAGTGGFGILSQVEHIATKLYATRALGLITKNHANLKATCLKCVGKGEVELMVKEPGVSHKKDHLPQRIPSGVLENDAGQIIGDL
jgi:hypothetical protein